MDTAASGVTPASDRDKSNTFNQQTTLTSFNKFNNSLTADYNRYASSLSNQKNTELQSFLEGGSVSQAGMYDNNNSKPQMKLLDTIKYKRRQNNFTSLLQNPMIYDLENLTAQSLHQLTK